MAPDIEFQTDDSRLELGNCTGPEDPAELQELTTTPQVAAPGAGLPVGFDEEEDTGDATIVGNVSAGLLAMTAHISAPPSSKYLPGEGATAPFVPPEEILELAKRHQQQRRAARQAEELTTSQKSASALLLEAVETAEQRGDSPIITLAPEPAESQSEVAAELEPAELESTELESTELESTNLQPQRLTTPSEPSPSEPSQPIVTQPSSRRMGSLARLLVTAVLFMTVGYWVSEWMRQ